MTMTNSITFSVDDIELLYAIPEQGADLAMIIGIFTSLHRSAPPRYAIVRDCFTKALQRGDQIGATHLKTKMSWGEQRLVSAF